MSQMERPPAPPIPAWRPLVEGLRDSSFRGHPVAMLGRVLDQLQGSGWEVNPLRGWVPSGNEMARIDRVFQAVGRSLYPNNAPTDARREARVTIAREFDRTNDAKWNLLARIAEARLAAVTQNLPRPQAPAQPARIRPAPLSLPKAPSYRSDDNQFTVYIDENWPDDKRWGVIAGIVWVGEAPNFDDLPWIETHSYRKKLREIEQILRRLYGCDRSFPFIMPIQMDYGSAKTRYRELIGACLQLLLGWLLPSPKTRANVCVRLERFDTNVDGSTATEFYRGLLRGAGQANPGRFGLWQLLEVRWCSKNHDYIPYADLMAHCTLEHTNRNFRLGQIARYRELPGYLPFSLDLVPLLTRLDGFEASGNVSDFLDLASHVGGTAVCDRAITGVQVGLKMKPGLRRALLEELDRRYMQKNRDLHSLRRQLLAAKRAVGSLNENDGSRLNLLWSAVELQDANHLGDPAAVDCAALRYAEFRNKAIQHDRELTVHTDLHLAVHEVDSFRFDRAEIMIEEIRSASWFGFLSPFHRAAVLSSLGQHRSIGREYQDAEGLFNQAISLFREADLADDDRGREINQTSVYRTINAVDGGLPHWRELLTETICRSGESLASAAQRFATASSPGTEYQHHLLLRTLFFRSTELSGEAKAYLDVCYQWTEL